MGTGTRRSGGHDQRLKLQTSFPITNTRPLLIGDLNRQQVYNSERESMGHKWGEFQNLAKHKTFAWQRCHGIVRRACNLAWPPLLPEVHRLTVALSGLIKNSLQRWLLSGEHNIKLAAAAGSSLCHKIAPWGWSTTQSRCPILPQTEFVSRMFIWIWDTSLAQRLHQRLYLINTLMCLLRSFRAPIPMSYPGSTLKIHELSGSNTTHTQSTDFPLF